MKIFLFLTTLLISFGFTNAQSSGSSDVSGVYQAFYMNSEPIDVDGLSMYYILNSKGVVLISLGSSSGSAFSNTSEGIRNGRITGGSYNKNGNSLTLIIGDSKTKSNWTYSPSQRTITNNNKESKLKYIESL